MKSKPRNRSRGKEKGTQFEREVCRKLSLWISNNTQEALFWRSAMSGGRATIALREGKILATQTGDISAIHRKGHELIDSFFIECKFYKTLDIERFVLGKKGNLYNFWEETKTKSGEVNKLPLLITKQNFSPILLLCSVNPKSWPLSIKVFDLEEILFFTIPKLSAQAYAFDNIAEAIKFI